MGRMAGPLLLPRNEFANRLLVSMRMPVFANQQVLGRDRPTADIEGATSERQLSASRPVRQIRPQGVPNQRLAATLRSRGQRADPFIKPKRRLDRRFPGQKPIGGILPAHLRWVKFIQFETLELRLHNPGWKKLLRFLRFRRISWIFHARTRVNRVF